jgi:micrococcal nuclease
MRPLRWIAVLACALLAFAGHARVLVAQVVYVTDGDTVWLRTAPGEAAWPVRLQGIDAPEICQPHGPQAQAELARRIAQRRVKVYTQGKDGFDRTLARIELRGEDLGAWMVVQGHAWSQRWRGRPGAYGELELQARLERRGLWRQPDPTMPREFRQRHGACPR